MNKWIGAAACAVAVACGVDADIADELVADAGQVVVDAGNALVDAGTAMGDADIAPVADAQQAPVARVRESSCNISRDTITADGKVARTEKFASFELDADEVRQVWLCDGPAITTTCQGASCTGAVIPRPDCITSQGFTAGSSLWVQCTGDYKRARVVLD